MSTVVALVTGPSFEHAASKTIVAPFVESVPRLANGAVADPPYSLSKLLAASRTSPVNVPRSAPDPAVP
jgi:hypothetical protein